MSQVPGFKYLIKRSGENGNIGRIEDAVQVFDDSPIIDVLVKDRNYYLGAKEEYEVYTGLVAGDMDGDGDRDAEDRKIVKRLKG